MNEFANAMLDAGMPKPRVYIVEDPAPNAFATGRNPKHSAIAVTTGLLQLMNRDELEGVLAHELCHVRNYDILVNSMVVVLVGAATNMVGKVSAEYVKYRAVRKLPPKHSGEYHEALEGFHQE